MKLLVTNDWHLTLRNPVARIDDYIEELFTLMDQIKLLAIKVKASAILHAGDVFHEKTGTKHTLVNRLMEWCQELRANHIEFIAIPGNHDLNLDRYDILPQQPLQTMFLSGLIRNVSFSTYRIPSDRDEATVSVVGVPYPAAKMIESFSTIPPSHAHVRIVMAHTFATPAGGMFYKDKVLAYSDLAALPFEIFIFGHDHSDNGVHQIGEKYFINIGALSRGSIARENLQRTIKVALITIEDAQEYKVQQVRLNYKPASECFDLELKAQKDREADQIDQFTEHVAADLEGVGIDYQAKLKTVDMPDTVRARVEAYLEGAEAQMP